MKVVLVYNQKSGGQTSKDELLRFFNDANIEVMATIAVGPDMHQRLKKHITAAATIAVVGGDGTISTVAGMLAGTRAALLPLPGGTLNHFTQDLGVHQDIKTAIQNSTSAKVRAIDIASVNDRYFINNSSIGLYPASLHARTRLEGVLGKWPAAVVSSFRSLLRFRTYEVTIDGRTFRTPFVFVGNNAYVIHNGLDGRKTLDSGILSVIAVRTVSRLELARIAVMTLVGKANEQSRLDTFTATHVTIRFGHKRVKVSHDGEFSYQKPPLHYELHAGKLRVLV